MPGGSPRRRLIAKLVVAVAALALFASSLASLSALDGELQGAVSAERAPVSAPVSYDAPAREQDGDCPAHDRRGPPPSFRS